jgi:N-acetylneuraminate synthase
VAELDIAGRRIGDGHPAYVIAELSANHHGEYDRALELLRAAHAAGADAVKLQTYTADTMTLASDAPPFRIGEGTLWEGRNLHDLYEEAAMPWDWQPKLKAEADALGIHLFSTPFDGSALDFLEDLGVPAYKIASFEIVDLALVREVAATGRPVIISTGMANDAEIDAALTAATTAGAGGVALLRCNSAYPASAAEMDLRTIPDMVARWGVPVGLSDHTLGTTAAITAIALGACIIEKHFTLSRSEPGPDSAFSLEPNEFRLLVDAVRDAEASLGTVRYGPSPSERASLAFRRSLFVVADVAAGDVFTEENVRAIRPGDGLPPVELDRVLGKRALVDIERGTPLSWELVES